MKKRYWRRSSRWRSALARTNELQLNYHRLQTLAWNHNPFGGYAILPWLAAKEVARIGPTIRKICKVSPYLQLIEAGRFGDFSVEREVRYS